MKLKEEIYGRLKQGRTDVLGIGISNLPLIRLLCKMGADVTARDMKTEEQLGDIAAELKCLGVRLVTGEGYLENIEGDIIFRAPGIRPDLPQIKAATDRGALLTSEMEFFLEITPATVLGITGSDGKTTTTTLTSKILARQLEKNGRGRVWVGGNIRKPLLPEIENITAEDFVVAELSSFQLISMRKSPDVAVVTNVAPNHLDVHKSMDEYVEAKKNVILHQNAVSRTVLNRDNDITESFRQFVRGQSLGFSMERQLHNGAWLDSKGYLHMAYRGIDVPVMHKRDITILGDHNVANYLTAIAAVWGYVGVDTIKKVAKEFKGVEHRIEFVKEVNGVKYYNDSIASSPTRTIAGLKAFDKKVHLIAGGYDKHIPFEPMVPYILENVEKLYLCGNTAEKIEDAVRASLDYKGTPEIIHCENIEDAVNKAHKNTKKGDIVTLSPACASFDAYPNFMARGNHFKELVNKL